MSPKSRLRPHPRERFAGPTQYLDLNEAARKLRAEPHEGIDGHRQVALGHRYGLTLLLFTFEPGGVLKEHDADGVTTIHALNGSLDVMVEGEKRPLKGGELLVIAPNVPHALAARESSTVLVSVALAPDAKAGE